MKASVMTSGYIRQFYGIYDFFVPLVDHERELAAANRRAWRHLGRAFEADYYRKGWEVFRVHRPQTRRVLRNWNSETHNWLEPGDRAARLCNYWGREPEE